VLQYSPILPDDKFRGKGTQWSGRYHLNLSYSGRTGIVGVELRYFDLGG
jgi:hypothetical protein